MHLKADELKLCLRKFVLGIFTLDDLLVIPALVLVLGFAFLSIIVTFYGVGYHQEDVPMHTLVKMELVCALACSIHIQ